MDTIGKRIKDLRTKNSMTQAQLGAVLGIVQKGVSKIENDTNNVTVQQLHILSSYFGVSADYLLFGNEQQIITNTERDILALIREDNVVYKSITALLSAKKNVLNRLSV